MAEHRGRPKDIPQEVKEKWVRVFYEYPSKPEIGCTYTWHYDNSKTKSGPFKTEITYPKGFKSEKLKADKGKAYGKQPVVMVFKTSNRSNAKTKMKIWANENIDWIVSQSKLVGIPEGAITLELSVGKGFIEKYTSKYNL
tara:strand:- start:65 stop:484 length:420 start_codon:yes stop_codon:yes gene_type:complete